MNNPLTLTASQAAELHTTGRLTGYREKCDPKLPKRGVISCQPFVDRKKRRWGVNYFVPPEMSFNRMHTSGTKTRYVKEPYRLSTRIPGHIMLERDNPGIAYDFLPADTMPDGDEYLHARITDIKLIISDGELWWDMDLEKVAK